MNNEFRKLVKTYKIYKKCPICKQGTMNSEDHATAIMMQLFCSQKILHKCTKCGYEEEYDVIYPHEEIEEIDEEI